jgi:hypothetical protein
MKTPNTLGTHLFSDGGIPRMIQQDGRAIYHHRCLRCGRDFAQGMNGAGFQAVYVGLLRIELLADSITERWLSEECPKQMLWIQDEQARSMRHA